MSVLQLYVGDLERCAEFYRDVIGLELSLDDDGGPGTEHYEAWWPATGERDHLYLAFWADPSRRSQVRWGFSVADLDEVHRRAVVAGVEVESGPADGDYGRRAIYRDPDGNTVSVGQR